MGDVSVRIIGQNQASITFPPGLRGSFDIITNSSYTQFVTIERDGRPETFSGSGEFKQVASGPFEGSARPIKLTFEFSPDGPSGRRRPSQIQAGLPSPIGPRYNTLSILSEDGADEDFDDAIFTLRWVGPLN